MTEISQDMDLTGKLLIAMPGMGDPRFAHSVVLLCAHSADGAMGLIINKPTSDLRLRDLLEQLSIAATGQTRNLPVHFGGPVEHGRGFVLHDRNYQSTLTSLKVNDDFAMTATRHWPRARASGAWLCGMGAGTARIRTGTKRLADL